MTNNASPAGEKILEGNKAIAEFMGLSYRADTGDGEKGYLFPRNGNFGRRLMPRWMKYHSSWDWLMPVVEKINKEWESSDMGGDEFLPGECIIQCIRIALGTVNIKSAHELVIDFITWYNQQTPSNEQ